MGNMLTASSVVVGTLWAAWKMTITIRISLAEFNAKMEQLQRDVKGVIVVQREHAEKLTQVFVMQERMADGKQRMDAIEERVRDLERSLR